MTKPEHPDQHELRYGVRFPNITTPVLHGIVAVYFEVARGETIEPWRLECSYEADFDSLSGADYRLGSVLNPQSKLQIFPTGTEDIMQVSFYPNHPRHEDDHPGSRAYDRSQQIEHEFARRINELFVVLGVAEPIPVLR